MAASITAIMGGQAQITSSRIADVIGQFDGYEENQVPYMRVMRMHRDAAFANTAGRHDSLATQALSVWNDVVTDGERHGFRNGQVTVLMPCGTVGFMMDSQTTGVEPELALVKHKKLVGGGFLKLANDMVPLALFALGYTPEQSSRIVEYIEKTDTIEGAKDLKPEHLPVFDCSFKPRNGERSIHFSGHIKMMAAVQPFISGAISKTVNLPEESTVDDIMEAYIDSWRRGLKAVAIYRDNSKGSQPLNVSADKKPQVALLPILLPVSLEPRRHLPDERPSITHKFDVGGHEGYLTVGLFEDGTPGELFVTMSKEGSTISGLMDSFATAISYCMQYKVPLKFLVAKYAHVRFEPSGWTKNKDIPYAKSLPDYIFRWLGIKFLNILPVELAVPQNIDIHVHSEDSHPDHSDAPSCAECGSIMTRNGSCYKCGNCGGTSGCS